MIQWHPLFVRLLRPVVEDYYEIETNVAVGDVPREADIVLLRRAEAAEPAFEVVWKYLTPWNVLEYKGPSVSARVSDLRLLVELGLGIYRKVNEERAKNKQRPVAASEVSFWYLRHHLGARFRTRAQRLLGVNALEQRAAGIWTCRLLDHLVYLVSGEGLPLSRESFPLQFLQPQLPAWDRAAAELILGDAALQESCASLLPTLHPGLLKEIVNMARTRTKWPKPDLEPLVEWMGGIEAVIKQLGMERVLNEVGIKRVIDKVGVKQVIDEVGVKRVIDEVGLDELFANLSPTQRRALKRRLEDR
jgi:hypothetical protein